MNTPIKKMFVLAGAWLVTMSASAQNYNIDWFTIDGGGGTSSGGVFTVSGAIGQPDASEPMTGGQYSLVGGFWGIVAAIQTPGAPLLTVTRDFTTGTITVAWDAPATGFVLDQTATLAASPAVPWSQIGPPYQTNAGKIFINAPSPAGNRFYRLRKP